MLNDPVNLVDVDGLSPEDIKKIQNIMHTYVLFLVDNNLRRPGYGSLNGWLNNLQHWTKGYYGCIDQATNLIPYLEDETFEDKWKFELYRYNLFHTNIKATSDKGELIYIDPWRDGILWE